MKCVAYTKPSDQDHPDAQGSVYRVTDEKAAQLVQTGDWKYTSKKAWKDSGRKRG